MKKVSKWELKEKIYDTVSEFKTDMSFDRENDNGTKMYFNMFLSDLLYRLEEKIFDEIDNLYKDNDESE